MANGNEITIYCDVCRNPSAKENIRRLTVYNARAARKKGAKKLGGKNICLGCYDRIFNQPMPQKNDEKDVPPERPFQTQDKPIGEA